MKKIPLSKGFVALVDDEDFEWLSKLKWYCNTQGYARTSMGPRKAYMHNMLCPTPKGVGVDHANGNQLDNRRANLRPANQTQNTQNSRRRSDNTTGFKGTSFNKRLGKFQAYINYGGKMRHLGFFLSLEEARQAYAAAATEHFGEFARV